MVKVQEYKPDKFLVNVTKKEAMLLIKSFAAQLYSNDCNRDRIEFMRHNGDDAKYFSIAVDELVMTTEFNVMTNMVNIDDPTYDVSVNRFPTMKEARKFMGEFCKEGIMNKDDMWIREVTI